MSGKKARARSRAKRAEQRQRSRRRVEESTPAGEERKMDQFQQMDGAESTYFKKA